MIKKIIKKVTKKLDAPKPHDDSYKGLAAVTPVAVEPANVKRNWWQRFWNPD